MSELRSALAALKVPPVRASQQAAQQVVPPPSPAPGAKHAWTQEQRAAIFCLDSRVRLTALAGCGKSAVLSAYAAHRPRQKWQYLAFNRAMAQEASAQFPSNVRASTFHAWAWPRYGVDLAHKMDRKPNPLLLADFLGLPPQAPWLPGYLEVLWLGLERFTRSADPTPSRVHLPAAEWALWRQSEGARDALGMPVAEQHLSQLWFAAQDPREEAVPASPDTAIKRAQLSRMPSLASGLLVDEAQDLSPAMLAWICQHPGDRVRAGDPYQTLYAWRAGGAGQWELEGETALALTASHRFGPQLEEWVNPVLASLGCELTLTGRGMPTRIHRNQVALPHWVLGRTRASLMAEAAVLQSTGLKLAWRGDQAWHRLAQVKALAAGRLDAVQEPLLRGFATLDAFLDAATKAGLDEWVELARQAQTTTLAVDPAAFVPVDQADVVLSTVHQAKGLTLDRVRLLPDVFDRDASPEELRVRYVALTRARLELSLPESATTTDLVPAPAVVKPHAGEGFGD